MTEDNGASASGPGSREPSPEGLGPSGFDPSRVATISLSYRDDGGLRVWSDQFSGLLLSHSSPELVMRDVLPALAVLGFPAPFATGDGGWSMVQRWFEPRRVVRLNVPGSENGRQRIEVQFADGDSIGVEADGIDQAWKSLHEMVADLNGPAVDASRDAKTSDPPHPSPESLGG